MRHLWEAKGSGNRKTQIFEFPNSCTCCSLSRKIFPYLGLLTSMRHSYTQPTAYHFMVCSCSSVCPSTHSIVGYWRARRLMHTSACHCFGFASSSGDTPGWGLPFNCFYILTLHPTSDGLYPNRYTETLTLILQRVKHCNLSAMPPTTLLLMASKVLN
jgi:hypothetical protein